jgi:GNAT superfamily N-acetyltransferase
MLLGCRNGRPTRSSPVDRDPERHGWIVQIDGQPAAFVDMEIEAGRGSLTLYVRPELRRRGIGRAILRSLAPVSADVGAVELVGHVDRDNTVSIGCVRAAGFVLEAVDDSGLVFTLPLSDT